VHWISLTELFSMPHYTEDGDNGSQPDHVTPDSRSGSLCVGSDTSLTKMLNLTKKEPRRLLHLMRHAGKKIQNLDE